MRTYQRTIKWKAELTGVGLHTGNQSTITFHPAAPNSGIRFIRTDLTEKPSVPALIDYVDDINRGTTLKNGEAVVHTVEHVLAAISGLEIDNVDIELTNNEPPVMDGSAMPFVEVLKNAGFEDQNAPRKYLVVDETVSYKDAKRNTEIVALPLDDYRVTVMVDFQNPSLGSQHTGLFSLEEEFETEFASARTFCFLKELEMLSDHGLIKGGSLDSAVVIVDEDYSDERLAEIKTKLGLKGNFTIGESGFINDKKLRYSNEPCRHKLLDLIGDMSLLGVPVRAQILAARAGHDANIEFTKLLKKLYDKKQLTQKYQTTPTSGAVFDINAIEKILPHRYPFLLVDKIVSLEMGKKIVGIKNVTRNEEFFEGHFPQHPIMPGVLIIEAMAQVGGILLLNEVPNPETKLVYFTGINNAKFKAPVIPGDQLVFELETVNKRRNIYKMSGKALVDGKVVCEADLSAAIVNK